MKFEKGKEYDDIRFPEEWRPAAGFEFKFEIPFFAVGLFSYRSFTWTCFMGGGGYSSWSYHLRKLKYMIPHTGYGCWTKKSGYRPQWSIQPGVYSEGTHGHAVMKPQEQIIKDYSGEAK